MSDKVISFEEKSSDIKIFEYFDSLSEFKGILNL
jgi:hypothetical protein